MSGTQIFILLMVIIGILAGALIGFSLYFIQYKKKVHRQAQSNQIYLCKKMEVIVKMLEIIADPSRDRDTAIAESHKLANQVIGNIAEEQKIINQKNEQEDSSNAELNKKILELIKEIKK